ncbi:MAG: hypothetical protein EXR11_10605 [Rhodospirillaceae bacterium]|nr:hypothetical protein [Rhodospirillaceae bacterium]
MKQGRIVRYTAEQLRKLPSDTDWARVNAMTDEEIAANVASDPDAWDTPPGFWDDAMLVYPPHKKVITLGVDDDVLAFFKRQGKGYQTRMNAVLRTFMVHKSMTANRKKSGGAKPVHGLAETQAPYRAGKKAKRRTAKP